MNARTPGCQPITSRLRESGPVAFNVNVAARESRLLVDSPVASVYDVVCRAPRSGFGELELTTVPQITLTRRGVFTVRRRGEDRVADTTTALLFGLDDEYRVSHPSGNGDECTVVVPPLDLIEQVCGGVSGRVGRLESRDQLAICLATRALRDPGADRLELEEAAMLLLLPVSSAFGKPTGVEPSKLGPAQRRRVEEARSLLASAPAAPWDLRTLSGRVRCSPFHLARQFRAATGETISRYLLRLRLAVAIERLADDERNLAALAVEVGFAHHSHFSARFRRTFGVTPAQARELLTKPKVGELRALVVQPALVARA